jgi:hypothetical protein
MHTGKYLGFNFLDEGMLVLSTVFIAQKLAEFNQINNCLKKGQILDSTHCYLTEILYSKTTAELILYIRERFSSYLGFDFAGLLFFSDKGRVY